MRCEARLPRVAAHACPRCQAVAAPSAGAPCAPCAACAAARAAGDPLDACCAAVWFEGDAARYVRRFKYASPGLAGWDPGAEAVARRLIPEAAARVPGPAPDALVPVPLHPARVRRRGFAPAAILAAALARGLRVPVVAVLGRRRDTPSQTGLDRPARRANVAGCFAAVRPLPGPEVWLIDDVVTTGATLGEAARVLRAAGARRVAAVCLARTPAPPC